MNNEIFICYLSQFLSLVNANKILTVVQILCSLSKNKCKFSYSQGQ